MTGNGGQSADLGPGTALSDGYSGSVASVDIDRALVLSERISVVRSALLGSIQRLTDSCSRLEITRDQMRAGRSRREILHDSAYARLEARLETMPVIEQAKGILMAQNGCGPDEAFDMLRRASQRANVRVRDLADEIVTRAGEHPQNGRSRPSRDGQRPPGRGKLPSVGTNPAHESGGAIG